MVTLAGSMAAGDQQSTGQVAEGLELMICQLEAERDWAWCGFSKPPSPPQVTHLLQGHTFQTFLKQFHQLETKHHSGATGELPRQGAYSYQDI